MRKFWTQARIRRVAAAVALALTLSVLFAFTLPKDNALFRGDFPAFYAAAVTVQQAQGADLYNAKTSGEIQNRFWPELRGDYLAFAYPPYVAVLLSPLALFSATVAKCIWVALMGLCLALSIAVSEKFIPWFQGAKIRAFIFFLCFLPLLSGLAAGQNVCVSLLLFTLALRFIALERRDFAGGIVLGCWLIKPHFAILALALILCAGRWRVLWGVVPPAIIFYLLGVHAMGWDWPFLWFHAVQEFSPQDYVANGHQMISFSGFFHALGTGTLSESSIAIISGIASSALFLFVALLFFRSRNREPEQFLETMFLAAPTLLLVSQHTLYYDLPIASLSVLGCLDWRKDRDVTFLVLLVVLCDLFTLARPLLPFQPLTFIVILALILVYRTVQTKKPLFN